MVLKKHYDFYLLKGIINKSICSKRDLKLDKLNPPAKKLTAYYYTYSAYRHIAISLPYHRTPLWHT